MANPSVEWSFADNLAAGQSALKRGAWEEARACFKAAIAQGETPEALEGLTWASSLLGDGDTALQSGERAYRLYQEKGDRCSAARAAMWLSVDYLDFRGEGAIANGWRQRARRLLADIEPAPEHGWLALIEGDVALLMHNDTGTAKKCAEEAVEIGRTLGVLDLELIGLSMQGISLVSEGLVDEGMQRLDEANAAALVGELQELVSIPWTFCYLIYACEKVRDYDRAAQWCQKMREFVERMQIRFALGVCRAHYAGVLVWRGSWSDAELELFGAAEDLLACRPVYASEATVRLAELRRRQGRLEEAAELFAQAEAHPLAIVGHAELALDLGDPQDAVDVLQRFLRQLPPENVTERLAALEILARAYAALGDEARAEEVCNTLQSISTSLQTQPLRASGNFSAGVVAAARGDYGGAKQHFEDAVDLFERARAPYETAHSRIELANVLLILGRFALAEKEAQAALGVLQRLGSEREAERAAAVVRQAAALARNAGSESSPGSPLTPREIEVLRLVANGRNDKEIASELYLSEHTVHRHIANILNKFEVSSRAAAVAYAARQNLL